LASAQIESVCSRFSTIRTPDTARPF